MDAELMTRMVVIAYVEGWANQPEVNAVEPPGMTVADVQVEAVAGWRGSSVRAALIGLRLYHRDSERATIADVLRDVPADRVLAILEAPDA